MLVTGGPARASFRHVWRARVCACACVRDGEDEEEGACVCVRVWVFEMRKKSVRGE